MTRAVLSLGSNLGDRSAHLRSARDGFAGVLVAASPVYETAPWGGVDQPDFLNMVLVVDDPAADAWAWLRRGQALEDAAEAPPARRGRAARRPAWPSPPPPAPWPSSGPPLLRAAP